MRHQFAWMTFFVAAGVVLILLTTASAAQQSRTIIFDAQQGIYYADANDRTIRALPVRENIYMIVGAGANITVHLGDEGVLVVDTGSGTANEKVLSLIRQLSTKPIRYIVNTSSRPDHTGGN